MLYKEWVLETGFRVVGGKLGTIKLRYPQFGSKLKEDPTFVNGMENRTVSHVRTLALLSLCNLVLT